MIVCGTDFSLAARKAANVAALLASRTGRPLELVCATPARHAATVEPAVHADSAPASRATSMDEELARLRALGAQVEGGVEDAEPTLVLRRLAQRPATTLLVLGARGQSLIERALLGSVAERVAMESPKPVLVVRDDAAWGEWASGARPLRVLVAFDPGASASQALEWAASLAALGNVQLTVCWVVNPGLENQRAGATGEGAGIDLLPKTHETLSRQLTALVGLRGTLPSIERVILANPGRIDSALTHHAVSNGIDLLVVGSHQRHGFERLWHTSVSRGVLHGAPMDVALIPHRRETAG